VPLISNLSAVKITGVVDDIIINNNNDDKVATQEATDDNSWRLSPASISEVDELSYCYDTELHEFLIDAFQDSEST